MKYICMFFIFLYRKFISPLKRNPTCRFYPSCSQYAMEAFEMHGFFGGTYLSIKRILRCNPFGGSGIDNVPPKITFKKSSSKKEKEI